MIDKSLLTCTGDPIHHLSVVECDSESAALILIIIADFIASLIMANAARLNCFRRICDGDVNGWLRDDNHLRLRLWLWRWLWLGDHWYCYCCCYWH